MRLMLNKKLHCTTLLNLDFMNWQIIVKQIYLTFAEKMPIKDYCVEAYKYCK